MLSEDNKAKLKEIAFSNGTILPGMFTKEELDFMVEYYKSNVKSENKEEVMNKYLVMADGVFVEVNGIDNAKLKAEQFVLETNDEVKVYELKLTASVVKPKVEFKEV